MTFTLGTAAKACGINKTTVLKAIKTGRLSGTRTDNGNWSIEPVELFRVFPPVATEDNVADNVAKQRETTGQTTALEAEIESLKATAMLLRTTLDDTRQDRDHWRSMAVKAQDQAATATRLLTDRTTLQSPSWWRRLAG